MNLLLFRGLCLFLAIFSSTTFAQNNSTLDHHPGQIQDDLSLVAAVKAKHNEFYVEAGNLVVNKLLPDDTSGLPHQKWQARLSNGSIITVIYNSNMGERVPLHVGEKFSVGGQFIWSRNAGIIHWLHDDPKKIRPDGYVYLNGVIYGDSDHEDNPNIKN